MLKCHCIKRICHVHELSCPLAEQLIICCPMCVWVCVCMGDGDGGLVIVCDVGARNKRKKKTENCGEILNN